MKLALLLVFSFAGKVAGQSPATSDCEGFSAAITQAEKDLSMLQVESMRENSAPREAARQQTMGNDLQIISLNLTLAAQAKCAPRKEPITTRAYMASATECVDATLKFALNNQPEPDIIPECDRTKWKRASK